MVCQILSNNVGIFVQCGLGACAIGGLVLKRILETPKRVFRVFIRDVSKQIIGSLFAHQLNLLIAIQMTQGRDAKSVDQCMWYFMNYLVDVLLGVFLNWGLVRLVNSVANRYGWQSLQSGDYITDHRRINRSYMLQLGAWLGIVLTCKMILWGVILIPLHGPLGDMGTYLLHPVTTDPTLELVLVMIIVPLFLNLLQFWIQDDFLQGSPTHDSGGETISYCSFNENLRKRKKEKKRKSETKDGKTGEGTKKPSGILTTQVLDQSMEYEGYVEL